jgi:predicted dehydrogenase
MITIAVIGCGHWGPNFVRNFTRLPGSAVLEVCDSDTKKLRHIKSLYPSVKTQPDYRGVLRNKRIDAVVIATPAATHYQLAREALACGKHVLLEKPIALGLREAENLVAISKRRNKVLMVGHTFLYHPAIRTMKKIIDKQELGSLYYLHAKRTNLGPLRKDVSAMWDLAPHDISIFNYLIGSTPIQAVARGQDYLQKKTIDVAFITLTYPHNIIANIHVSWLDPRKVREVTVVGSRKMLVFDDLSQDAPIRMYDKRVMKKKYGQDYTSFEEFQMIIHEGLVTNPVFKTEEPLKVECEHFLSCVKTGELPLTCGEHARTILKTLLAAQQSLDKNGAPVACK